MQREGLLLVVSGPSGVGKGTVIRELMRRRPQLRRSISCTTRAARKNETHGVEYFFVTHDEFSRMRDAGELLEWATVHTDTSYGTPRKPVEDALAAGEDIILEIDYQGARTVRCTLGRRAVLVFIAPPSWEELESRLVGRETESPDAVRQRLNTARREIAHMDLFEYVIVNGTVKKAADELEAILVAEGCRAVRVDRDGLVKGLLGSGG
ncbi:MAG: guanylate kinase [Armatimonadetes bacterium]|nr:guanylate kinase [Armatimonadota bacterium]